MVKIVDVAPAMVVRLLLLPVIQIISWLLSQNYGSGESSSNLRFKLATHVEGN
jgi:hypothetical protein